MLDRHLGLILFPKNVLNFFFAICGSNGSLHWLQLHVNIKYSQEQQCMSLLVIVHLKFVKSEEHPHSNLIKNSLLHA